MSELKYSTLNECPVSNDQALTWMYGAIWFRDRLQIPMYSHYHSVEQFGSVALYYFWQNMLQQSIHMSGEKQRGWRLKIKAEGEGLLNYNPQWSKTKAIKTSSPTTILSGHS